ncbi:MAG TPA: hypothetical protein VFK04_19160 [Gemmatimonadaceae bacterium]|jgi:hypothetical protein|nr:hypothetical protein [Gemmatimonadaceae bacterium]
MQHYGTVVVVGGGCYGSYYVRQLGRAVNAGALAYDRLLVVDKDSGCRVAAELEDPARERVAGAPDPDVVVSDWSAFFERYFDEASSNGAAADAIVPSPLMPHLMYQWLLERARKRWPDRVVETRPFEGSPPMPWQYRADDGTSYVSYATWTCPINCVEPATCPHTRGPRSWSMPPGVRDYVRSERERGRELAGPAIFHCTHRAYGVGMFDTADVLEADRLVIEAGTAGAAEVLIGTVSHCHGALNVLGIGAK